MKTKSSRRLDIVVPEWLVLGSFANADWMRLLDYPFLPEEQLAPTAGCKAGTMQWRREICAAGILDFLTMPLKPSNYCVAYAFTYVHAAAAGPATLLMGSDDGLVVWLNGQKVWRVNVQRGLMLNQDAIPVRLEKGWNRLLVKVNQHEGGWQTACFIQTAIPVKFSLKNPQPAKWQSSIPAVARLGMVSVMIDGEGEGKNSLAVSVFNHGTQKSGICKVAVTAGGREVAGSSIKNINGLETVSMRLPMPESRLSALLGSEDANVTISCGDSQQRNSLPASIIFQYLVKLVSARPEQSFVKLGKQLELLSQTFPDSHSRHFASFCRALTAMSKNNIASAEKEIKKTVEELAGQIAKDTTKKAGIHIVGHAHIDMNWLWTWPETIKCSHDTFRQMIAFMDEFPDVTFLQSQPSAYAAVEKIDPPLFKRIQHRVREGRWELAGGTFSEGDTNMSSGEALCRSFLLGQRYFLSRFGKIAVVGWQPDNFGHVAQMPQLLRLAGCSYYYCCRTTPHKGTFWWESPDGSRVLLYSNDNYNGRVRQELLNSFGRYAPKTRRMFQPTGVGDHGGGPTRQDIENAHMLDEMLGGAVKVRFDTAESFFRQSEKEMAGQPVHRGEMQYIFEGCYTSIARVKEGNRRCESTLGQAEFLSAIRRFAGDPYPAETLRNAWQVVTFNEFHDILCGSAIHESNADSVADYKWALGRAEEIREEGFRKLADEIKVDPSKGQPIVVLNTTPRPQTAMVEAEVFTHDLPATATFEGWGSVYKWNRLHERPPFEKEPHTVMLRDWRGKAIPAQIVWGKLFPPGYRWKLQFLVEDLPAGGYRAYYLDAAKPGCLRKPMKESKGQFDTDFFKVGFDLKTGLINRLFDKRTGTELAPKGKGLNQLRIYQEKPHSMSAWNIGPADKIENVTDVESVTITERGPVRACVEAVKCWGRSKFVQRTYVYQSCPRIDVELEAHWFEQGDSTKDSPMLRVVFPLAMNQPRFDCHTPFAAVQRPANGQEVPAQQWVDVTDGKCGVALLTRTKYGYSLDGSELRLTLLRSSYDPDIYPDQGLHRIHYAIFPHAGDWRKGEVWNQADVFDGPAVLAVEPPSLSLGKAHATRPLEASLVSLEPPNVVLSGMKEAEDGDELVVRLAEVEGRKTKATLTLPGQLQSARRLDIIERPLANAAVPQVRGQTITVELSPHEIVTLGVRCRQAIGR